MTRRRIAIAGFQHETNTFVPRPTGLDDFRQADSWPELLLGQNVVETTRGMNLPIAGAVMASEIAGDIDLVPILWCAAEPGGQVTDEAFETIATIIVDGIRKAGPLDAIYLDLHGAMVTVCHEDGEGELLRRIRAETGRDMPIGVSLDLHANISAPFVDQADIVTIYRTYPHLDMAETGQRCVDALLRRLSGPMPRKAFRQVPFLVPLHAQNTGAEPCRSLYAALDDLTDGPDEHVDLAMGFTAADIADCGPSVIAHAATEARAAELAEAMLGRVSASEALFDTSLLDAQAAVAQVMALGSGSGPVILADVQDNPGAGGSSDSTGLLRALVEGGAGNAMLGVICDPDTAARAHEMGQGGVFRGMLGGKSGLASDAPLVANYRVKALSDGRIRYSGAMYGGGIATIGPSCLLALEGAGADILIVVSSTRIQCLDRALFTHFGVEPLDADILCVKSTAHFRADFEPGSRAVINVAAPGWFPCELDRTAYRNLRPGVRV